MTPRRTLQSCYRSLVVATLLLAACRSGEGAWQEFESSDGLFSVQFPGKPTASSSQKLTGPTLTTVHTVILERGSTGIMQVSHYDLLPEAQDLLDADTILRIDCGHPYTDSSFQATEPMARTIAGQEGIVISGTAPRTSSMPKGGWTQHSCVIVGKRMYQLTAVGPDDAATRKSAERFLGSFDARVKKQ